MKKYFVLLLFYAQWSCSQNVTKEGVVVWDSYWLTERSEGGFDTTNRMSYNIYFYDSCVVYECKTFHSGYNGFKLKKQSTPIYKFTFFDLRTRFCQDYYSFTDTSTVQCHYKMPDGNSLYWNFWETHDDDDGNFVFVGDTIIGDELIKIVEKKNELAARINAKLQYYLTRNMHDIIFHLESGSIDRHFTGYKTFRKDVIVDDDRDCYEFSLLKDKLSFEERRVLKKWMKNAKTIDVPLINYDDVIKQCGTNNSPLLYDEPF